MLVRTRSALVVASLLALVAAAHVSSRPEPRQHAAAQRPDSTGSVTTFNSTIVAMPSYDSAGDTLRVSAEFAPMRAVIDSFSALVSVNRATLFRTRSSDPAMFTSQIFVPQQVAPVDARTKWF